MIERTAVGTRTARTTLEGRTGAPAHEVGWSRGRRILPAGSNTAIAKGNNGGTGVGLVEVYNLK